MILNTQNKLYYTRCFLYRFLLLSLLSVSASTYANDVVQLPAEEMEMVKAHLLSWSESLKSFAGNYTIDQLWSQEPERTPLHFDLTYRFQGENRLLTHAFVDSGGKSVVHTDALLDGTLSELHLIDEQSSPNVSGTLGLKAKNWLFPPGALLSPEILFGNLSEEEPLAEFFSTGETTLHERGGKRFLHHYNNGTVLVVYFDSKERVTCYELGYSDLFPAEVAEYWDGDPFEFKSLSKTLELKNYVEINGVSFPSSAVRTVWDFEDGPFEALRARYEAEKWEPIIFHVKACTELDVVPTLVQHFELDVNTAQVNADLPDLMFKIDYPEETVLFSASGERIQPGPGLWFWVLLVGGGIVLLALLGGGGWYWCYVR